MCYVMFSGAGDVFYQEESGLGVYPARAEVAGRHHARGQEERERRQGEGATEATWRMLSVLPIT